MFKVMNTHMRGIPVMHGAGAGHLMEAAMLRSHDQLTISLYLFYLDNPLMLDIFTHISAISSVT